MPHVEPLNGRVTDLERSGGGGGGGSTVVKAAAQITIPWPGGLFHTETVTLTGCTPSMVVVPAIAPHPDSDENDPTMLDVASLSATAGSGQATITAAFLTITSGVVRVNLMAT